ncbi:DnaJ domain-containing protein [Besnoitia besnoiti]|uniref:DnaJ domain-containing protein n=1 Tax=Besnoitia besnoiti TaxID=94643 RepID=A0A2A9MBA0_BESBE|nr:DnaJ domain-containing protein [Besnoitia besnoiti]PFH35159.1 DnaJ domain-containing protein [Besnoitia besnoiti]
MEDLIFHMFFVVPLTRWITNPERAWNRKSQRNGIILAVLALFCIGVIQSSRDSENYYETLGVPPGAPPKVVAGAYRKLSLQYHPDKNPHPDAKEIFEKIREAHEVLGNEKRRNSYCRFGDFSKEGEIDEEQFYDVLFLAVFQLLIPFLFAYLYTYGEDSVASRKIFACYVATSFSLEVLLRFDASAFDILSFVPFVGNLLPFEKIRLLHAWMPVVLNGLLLLGSELADVEDDILDSASRHILNSNLDALPCMERFLEAAEATLRASGGVAVKRAWIARGAGVAERSAADKALIAWVSGAEPKADLDEAARTRLRELGYVEVLHYVRPWRLNPAVVSEEMPDLWGAAMKPEVRNWPADLTMEDIATRAECTERGWDRRHDAILKLLDDAEEEDEKTGRGISVGTIIFFGSLLLRWYRGSS